MGFIANLKNRAMAMKIGMQLIGSGILTKEPGDLLSAIAKLVLPKWGEPPRRNSREWLELYSRNPRLRPVYRIARDVGAAGFGLYTTQGEEKERLKEHPLYDLLNKPNPKMTGHILLYLTEVWLQMRGEGGWLIERNGLKVPSELWPIPPHWVLQTPTVYTPYYQVQTDSGSTMRIAEEDMIWFNEPDPAHPYERGIGSAEGIGDEIETDEYMAKYAKNFFFNDGKPPVVIQAPGARKEEAERIKEEWMEKYSGWKNAHKPAVLPWDAKLQELGSTQQEMDFNESRKNLRDMANQHWFIPPEVMGIIENSNRATIDAADYLFAKGVLKPALDMIQDVIQNQLCPLFDDKLIFEFDNVVPDDKEFEHTVANDGLKNGTLTVDEWRIKHGYDPLPNNAGNVLYVPIGVVAVKPGETGSEPGVPPPAGGKSVAKLEMSPEQKTAFWWVQEKTAIKQEPVFKRVVKKYFQDQQNKINAKLEEIFGGKSYRKDAVNIPDIEGILAIILAWSEEDKRLQALLKAPWMACWKDAMQTADDTFGLAVNFDSLNPRFLDWVNTYGANQVTGINNTTKNALKEQLGEGIEAGESVPKLRDRVSSVFSAAKGSRAETIARTESHNSVSAGTFNTYKVAGIEKKEWLATKDSRTRDSHLALDGEVQPLDVPFSNGLMYPGATGPASEVINCRCSLLPVIIE